MISVATSKFTALVSGVVIAKEYPFLITDIDILPNEEWREIPYTDGYYEVSNLGRVKSLDREIVSKDGRRIKYNGKILKQSIIKIPNQTVGDLVFELVCRVKSNTTLKTFPLHRLVYTAFVKPLQFAKDKFVILHKNNDMLDNRAENLYVGTLSDKAKKIYDRKRGHKVSDCISAEAKQLGILNRCKCVSQYKVTGQKIAFFNSIKAAASKTKLSESSIAAACKQKKMVSAGGYLWQYGNGNFTIDVSYYTKFIEKGKAKVRKPISQFATNGQLVKSFTSIAQAEKYTGVKAANIGNCINGHTSTAGGFIWHLGKYSKDLDISLTHQNIIKSISNIKKPLLQICPYTHKVINVFDCATDAAAKLKIAKSANIRVAAGNKKLYGDYLWRFK